MNGELMGHARGHDLFDNVVALLIAVIRLARADVENTPKALSGAENTQKIQADAQSFLDALGELKGEILDRDYRNNF